MKIKTSIAVGLTIISTSVVSIFLIPESKAQKNQDFVQTEIPVVIKPLKLGDFIIPVEIQCQKVFITKPDTLDDFSCTLINRTDKIIRASIVKYSIIFDSNGKEEEDSRLDTTDTYIHPDLSKEKKPVEFGGEISVIPPGPIIKRDSIITRLELEPIYIEFADGTTAGTGGKGAELIASVREGAARYKKSLRQEYLTGERSAQEILPLLKDNAPLSSELENFSQRAGAKAYRSFLRKKYENEGVAAINDILDK